MSTIADTDWGFLFFALIVGVLVGLFIGGLFMSAGGNTTLSNNFIDNACNQTFGEGYAYEDNSWFGEDFEITCYNKTTYLEELNQPGLEKVWISKR